MAPFSRGLMAVSQRHHTHRGWSRFNFQLSFAHTRYLNDKVQGVRDFEDLNEARLWAVSTLWAALPLGDPERCHD